MSRGRRRVEREGRRGVDEGKGEEGEWEREEKEGNEGAREEME